MPLRSVLVAVSLLAAGCAARMEAPTSASTSRSYAAAESTTASDGVAAGGETAPERMIVRNASLNLYRSDPERGPELAAALVKGAGGWVAQSSTTSLMARVPAGKLEKFLADAAALGTVESRHVSGEDVTDQFRDTTIRLDNLIKIRGRYLELLAKSQGVSEAVMVEKELERVTLEIEHLKGQLQALEQTSRYSLVSLSFERETRPGPLGWVFYGLAKGVKWLFVWD